MHTGRTQHGYLDKGVIPVPGWMEWDGERLHHATQNSVQFKTYELFIFHLLFNNLIVIFHLIFSSG